MKKKTTGIGGSRATAIALFLPFAVTFILFTIVPIITALVLSLTSYNIVDAPLFVGIDNYINILTNDDTFIKSLANTIAFALFSGIIGYFASFTVAWIIDGLIMKKLFALAFYAPSITGSIAMSVIWLNFFSSDSSGFINNWLMKAGMISSPILWNQNPKYILFIVIVVSVWMGMGNGFLGFLAGFQNMDAELFEAAAIDGIKNNFQKLIYLVLPLMKPMLLYGAITTVTTAFATYEIPMTLAGYPGPENSSATLVGYINDHAFTRLDFGYSSTVAVFLFAITFLFGRAFFKVLGSEDE